jgi:glucose-6-phosphate isomerase
MATSKMPLTQRPSWKALQSHYRDIREQHLRQFFADDPTRGERLTGEAVGIYLDYSKNRVTDETLKLLVELGEQSGLRGRIDAMFQCEKINITENRAVLHVALRAPKGATIVVDGENYRPRHKNRKSKMKFGCRRSWSRLPRLTSIEL